VPEAGAIDRCDGASNSRTDSTVSPNSSMRTGRAAPRKDIDDAAAHGELAGSSTISVRRVAHGPRWVLILRGECQCLSRCGLR